MLLQWLEKRNDMKIFCQSITFSFQAFLTSHWYWFQLQQVLGVPELPVGGIHCPLMPMAGPYPALWSLVPPNKTSVQWHPLANNWRKKTLKAGILTCYVQGHLSTTWQLNVYWLAGVPCWRLNYLSVLLVTSYWVPTICSLPYGRRHSFRIFKQLSWNYNERR